jgi:SAM-dependent methyltransferase
MPKVDDWRWAGLDVDRPNAARMYDYALGGSHNFPADRAASEALTRVYPDAPLVGQSNRAFLRRAVRYCVEQSLSQFLDIGSGIATVGNVHEIAHRLDPASRVVYVDNDPVAAGTTRQMLAAVPNTAIVHADLRAVQEVLEAPETQQLLDFSQPLALLMVAVLHYVPIEDDAIGIVERYKSVLAPGSLFVVSHTTWDPRPEVAAAIRRVFDESGIVVAHRSRDEVAAFFAGLELVEPGVVWTPEWHPADDSEPLYDSPGRSATYAAVGRVPA